MAALFRKEKDIDIGPAAQAAVETPVAPTQPEPAAPASVPRPPERNKEEPAAPGQAQGEVGPHPEQTEKIDGGAERTSTQAPEQTPRGSSGGRKKQQPQKTATPPAVPAQPKTAERKEIEEVMSEGLAEVYQAMTPEQQAQFRAKGEEVATKIEVMMKTFSATAKKVAELIRSWLKTIPGVNKYFLEQESKIKTDTILKLQRKRRKEHRSKTIGMN